MVIINKQMYTFYREKDIHIDGTEQAVCSVGSFGKIGRTWLN